MMKVTKVERGYFQVVDGAKWYTASVLSNGALYVVNHKGRTINQGTAIHRAVTEAIFTSRAVSAH